MSLRTLLPLLAVTGAAALPAGAGAATVKHTPKTTSAQLTVLQALPGRHALRLVTARHAVHRYAFSGAATGLRPGSVVRVVFRGRRVTGVTARGRTRTIRFYGRVVSHTATKTVLRLGDGSTFVVRAAGRARGVSGPAVALGANQLRPGQTVLVTVTADTVDATGARSDKGGPQVVNRGSGAPTASVTGQVVSLDPAGNLVVQSTDGARHALSVPAPVLDESDPQVCDVVTVGYHTSGARQIADTIGVSDQAPDACVGDTTQGSTGAGTGSGTANEDQTVSGTVSSIGADLQSFVLSTDSGPMTFTATPDALTDITPGTDVVVSYFREDDGSLTADSVDTATDILSGVPGG